MNTSEKKIVSKLLRLAAEKFSNHGCNDFRFDMTPENREIARAAQMYLDDEWVLVMESDGEIIARDDILMEYFSEKLNHE